MNCQVPIYCQIDDFLMLFQNKGDARDFTTFWHCCMPAGDNTEMLESPVEYGKLGNYAMCNYWMNIQ